jgi:hypothetical protein
MGGADVLISVLRHGRGRCTNICVSVFPSFGFFPFDLSSPSTNHLKFMHKVLIYIVCILYIYIYIYHIKKIISYNMFCVSTIQLLRYHKKKMEELMQKTWCCVVCRTCTANWSFFSCYLVISGDAVGYKTYFKESLNFTDFSIFLIILFRLHEKSVNKILKLYQNFSLKLQGQIIYFCIFQLIFFYKIWWEKFYKNL